MPDVKAYAVGGATTLTNMSEGDNLLPLLPAGEYNLTLSSTATVTVPVLTAGSIVETSPTIGNKLTVSGSNATASAIYQWQESADGSTGWANITGATSASLDTSSGVTTDYHVRRQVTDGVQGPVETTGVQVSAAGPWAAPGDSPELIAWYDANDASTLSDNGSNITQMNDKSGNGYNLTPPIEGPFAKQRIVNGLNALDVNTARRQSLTVAGMNLPSSGDLLVSVVVQIDNEVRSKDQYAAPLAMDAASNDFQIDNGDTSETTFLGRLVVTGAGSTNVGPAATDLVGGTHIFTAVFDKTGAGTYALYIDGTLVGSQTYSTNVSSIVELKLMSNRKGPSLDGALCEAVVEGDISLLGDINSYLATRWGVTI